MKRRVLRGGMYEDVTWFLRSTFRIWYEPVSRRRYFGFRVVIKRRKP